MDRREFLKKCGRTGLALSAGGVFGASFVREASGAGVLAPKLIKLKGTPKEMGRQYAEQAGELVIERLKRFEEKGSRITRKMVEESRIFLTVSANNILTEIECLAAAIGESSKKLLILAAETPGAGIREGGCSSFVAKPRATKDKKVWVGQNIDDAGELERFGIVIIRHPHDAVPMMTWGLAGGVGGIGLNLNGITLTMNYVEATVKRPTNAIFPEFVANAALRQKTYNDARAVLAKTLLMAPVIFTLAKSSGSCDVIERLPHQVRGLGRQPFVEAATNHFISKGFQITEPEKRVFTNSRGRLKRLKQLLDRRDLTPKYLQTVLADTQGTPRGICRHAEPRTIASVLMCPIDKVMYALKGRPDRAKYERYVLTGQLTE